jgi:hypothetical protein
MTAFDPKAALLTRSQYVPVSRLVRTEQMETKEHQKSALARLLTGRLASLKPAIHSLL